jgi:uncharacterized protein (TIGR02186 family)
MILRALVLLLLTALPATAEEVVLGMSSDTISITTNFDGSELLVFGAVKREAPIAQGDPLEVIIAVAGPSEPLTMHRKDKKLGIWVNADAVEIDLAPSFYAIATTGPFIEVLSDVEDLRHKVSIPRAIRSVGAPMTVSDSQSFTEALIRIRSENGLYQLNEGTVSLDEQTLFRTSVELPADLTEGDYTTRIFLTRGGTVVSSFETSLDVRKVGLEKFLFDLSRQQPMIYGIMSLAIAIIAGWGASAAFQLLRRQ